MQYTPPGSYYTPSSPWETHMEALTTKALRANSLPAANIRIPKDHRILFPPRFGYPSTALTVEDVLGVSAYAPPNRTFLSGTPASFSGTSGPSMGTL